MPKETNLILVTGATGKQGGSVAHELLTAGHPIRIMTRKPESPAARELASRGAEVVRGDLDDVASLAPALEGAWGAYAVQNTWEAGVEREEVQGKHFAEAARKAGVQHYVYGSVASAHRHTGIPHFENKFRIEDRVRELGFPSWVILRPVYYMENLLMPDTKQAIDGGTLPLGIRPTTKLQMIAVADIGKYAKAVFEHPDRFAGRAIDIAGDELTPVEIANVLSRVTKHPVKHLQVPIEEIRKFSDDYAIMLEWFDALGYDADIAATTKEFGVQPTRFDDWTRRHWAPTAKASAEGSGRARDSLEVPR